MNRGRALAAGKKVGVIAPGSPAKPERYAGGCAAVRKLGYEVIAPLDPSEFYGKYDHGFASASVAARVSAFNKLLSDDDVSVIIAARGAYGSLELLPFLDFDLIRASKKLLVGYSDVSSLLVPIFACAGIPAIHGPTISKEFAEYEDSEESSKSVDELMLMLTDTSYRFKRKASVLRDGKAKGKIVASNLTALTTLLGTPWDTSLDGCMLFVEDIGEAPFRVQRCMEQLKLSGKLESLAGLVFGRFDRCQAKHGPSVSEVFDRVQSEMLNETDYPVLKDFPFGHNGLNIPLPLGCEVEIDSGEVSLLESPVVEERN